MIRRHKKLIIFLVIIVLIFGGIVAFIALNSTPDRLTEEERDQAVADILGRKPNLDPDIKTGNTLFDGETINFEYPAKAVIYDYVSESKKNNESVIETFSFDIDNPRLVINFTAMRKPNLRNIEDEPSVKLREDSSRGYVREERYTIDKILAAVYKKDGGGSVKAEKTAFVLRDGVFYTISITGASLEDVEELFEVIINSVEFQ